MKLVRNVFFVILIFCPGFLFSQITTNELPPSFTTPELISQKKVISLLAPDIEKIQSEDAINDKIPGTLKRFAVAIPVSFNSRTDGYWETLPGGDLIWRLTLHVKNAKSLDLTFDKFWLPDKGKFFLYNPESKQTIGAITSEFLRGGKMNPANFSTGIIYGDTLTLEYYQPSSLKEKPIISVSKVYYGYRSILKYETGTKGLGFGDSGDCQVNVNCSEGQNWYKEKRAVALILAKYADDEATCTGFLVNNTSNNLEPLFLTAHHNLNGEFDAISDPDLSEWIFYWEYEFPGCSQAGEPTHKSTTGATLKANNSNYADFALFDLIEDPKDLNNFIPYYLGWDYTGNSGTGGVGIHHPMGDVKKISTYNITPGYSDCYSPGSFYWKINWQSTLHGHSVTEDGSSGSPLINNNRKVIGQLRGSGSCSDPGCSNPSQDIANYGKFSVSWTGGDANDYRRRLDYWLDPQETDPDVLDGHDFPSITGSNIICSWGTTFSISSPPAAFDSIKWEIGSELSIVSGQGTSSCTITSVGESSSYIRATIWVDGNDIQLQDKTVWSGKPIFGSISGPNPPISYKGCTGQQYDFWASTARDPLSGSTYQWMVVPPYLDWYFQYQYYDWVTIVFNDPSDYYQVMGRTINTCGATGWQSKGVEIMDCYYFSMSPNPASDYVTITLTEPATDKNSGDLEIPLNYSVQILDYRGILHYDVTKSGESFTIPVSNLKDGSYFVRITYGKEIETKPLIIKH